jgi:dTDP-4-dehydrorhamnose reductase
MAGNSKRRGAIRKEGTKKGPTVGSGGVRRRGLEGRGATPPAHKRAHHPAAKRAALQARKTYNKPTDETEMVLGRNPVLECLRANAPAGALYVALGAEADERLTESVTLAADRGIPIIQVSTDYVFDGAKTAPYEETDSIAPQGAYGRTKAEGEARVAAANPRHAIVRTAWVFDATGKNFVRTMLRLATTRPRIGVVADQFGAPTFAPHIADGLLTVARNLASAPAPDMFGVFHMTAAEHCSWADFAEAIFAESAARGGPAAIVDRITTADYPTPAKRPANSRLSCEKIARVHGVRLPPWRAGLAQCMDAIAAGGWAAD